MKRIIILGINTTHYEFNEIEKTHRLDECTIWGEYTILEED